MTRAEVDQGWFRIISLTVPDLRRKSGIEKHVVKGQSLQLEIGEGREPKLL